MNKYVFLLGVLFSGGCAVFKNKTVSDYPQIQVCNIYNDSLLVTLPEKVTILTFIREPSCTGCKENLAIYLNGLGRKFNKCIILGKSESVLHKKSYNLYLEEKFKKNFQIYYSLSMSDLEFKLNESEYNFDYRKNPFVVVISDYGKQVDVYEYDKIFNNVFIKQSFKDSIKGY